MSTDVNLSSDDMAVECVLEPFERERVANKLSDPVRAGLLEKRLASGFWRSLVSNNQHEKE